ncbi:type IV pilus modification protein PilV [Pseudomonas sp. Fl5BN2]|uniref:type IV pilus modification protein PilV n=1 Tax=Pseudomonas sp. Fl5BN2 TaxID=2697652 RepID=UPI001376E8B3|nr:type IV pilus modification protein PilV [Pseudomonas sp. Fl5BN2]NBF06162.1 type IV pilus modification protein PilV [Pseudomonas sp. Fl5BN2]
MNEWHAQDGMTLIEVLVALLILVVGLLGAAAIQIKALQYTDSARMSTQASFIAYDMLDRIRANAAADYTLAAPAEGAPGNVRDQDLHDFASNVVNFGGPSARGSISASQQVYTIHITWDDSRAEGRVDSQRSLVLSSRIALGPGGVQ